VIQIPLLSSHDPTALVGEVASVLASEAGDTRSIPTFAAVA